MRPMCAAREIDDGRRRPSARAKGLVVAALCCAAHGGAGWDHSGLVQALEIAAKHKIAGN